MAQPFSTAEVKTLMTQLLSGVAYLHDRWILHRDLKTSNIRERSVFQRDSRRQRSPIAQLGAGLRLRRPERSQSACPPPPPPPHPVYTNRGQLKICDFGLARQYGSPLKPYTHCVVTLWCARGPAGPARHVLLWT